MPPRSTSHLAPLRRSVVADSRLGTTVTAVVLVALLVFAAVATTGTLRSNERQRATEERRLTESVGLSVDDRIAAYEEVLYGVRGALTLDPAMSRISFRQLVVELDIDTRQPGVQVIGVAHLVDVEDIDEYEDEVDTLVGLSGLPYPDFEVSPEPVDGQILAIDYLEPQEGNERAFGLDFFSEPNRRAAAERARDTGLPSATAPVTLVQETATQRAFLVMVPLYRRGVDTNTVAQRRDAFQGVVYAAFRMGDLMNGLLGEGGPDQVAIVDVDSGDVLFDRSGDFVDDSAAGVCPPFCPMGTGADERTVEIEIGGRTWRIFVENDGSVLSPVERAVPIVMLLCGLLVTALIAAVVGSMRSARRRALELATEMTIELEALTESADEGIVSIDEHGVIVAWNRSATRIFGADADTMVGRPVIELVAERAHDEFRAGYARFIAGDHETSDGPILLPGRRADGRDFPAEVSLSIWTAGGSTYLTGFVRDITTRIAAQRELVETFNLLRGVLDAATEVAIIGTELDGSINVFNRGAELMLGCSALDVLGVETPARFHDPAEVVERDAELGIDPGFEVFVAAARAGETETRQWTYVSADGRRFPVELTVTGRRDGDGNLCGFIGVATDVTDQLAAIRRQQELLDQERDMVVKLTELDQVKNDFVSTISHELRTPLTSILGYAELLIDDGDDIPAHHLDMIGVVDKNARRLLLLVEDLLSLSRIESGELHDVRRPCDMAPIFRTVERAIDPLAAAKEITVAYDLSDTPTIIGDVQRLERVFLNLLSNAVKFSRPGGHVGVESTVDGDHVVVVIADQGVGIPADEMDQLFNRFFRSRIAEREAIQGTGLGLTIVADIVKRHGGTIDVESDEGVGTTVTVRLPIAPVDRSVGSGDPAALDAGATTSA